eukprot:29018_1
MDNAGSAEFGLDNISKGTAENDEMKQNESFRPTKRSRKSESSSGRKLGNKISKGTRDTEADNSSNFGHHFQPPRRKLPAVRAPKVLPEKRKEEAAGAESFSAKLFSSMNLDARLANQLETHMNMKEPTIIQAKTIPVLLSKRDVLIRSQTGSGKTLAYLIPIVQQIQQSRVERSQGTQALIIAPTRELCLQIFTVLENVLRAYHWIVPGIVMGGERKKAEKQRLRKGCTVLVATPGRLLDHLITTRSFRIDQLRFMVLDEADRLLDMGFERDVEAIIEKLDARQTQRRQNILASATLDSRVADLIKLALSNPVHIGLTDSDGASDEAKKNPSGEENGISPLEISANSTENGDFVVPDTLKQMYIQVPSQSRLVALGAVLRSIIHESPQTKALVFMSTCAEVEFHYKLFSRSFWPDLRHLSREDLPHTPLLDCPVFRLHGNMAQRDRTKVYLDYCKTTGGVLLCTDVAARGLDLPFVNWVLQYEPPNDIAEYVHRIGRTARLGRSGSALLFLLPTELEYMQLLEARALRPTELQMAELFAKLGESARAAESKLVGRQRTPKNNQYGFWTRKAPESLLQEQFFEHVEDGEDIKELARRGFQSFVRSYAAYPKSMKHIFHVKNLHLGHVAKNFALKERPSRMHFSGVSRREFFTGKTESSPKKSNNKKTQKDLPESGNPNKSQPNYGRALRRKRDNFEMSEFAA